MSNKNRIFIIGHSGAGKGVLAQAIAQKLGWRFIDADFALAPSIGRTLSEIIGSEGEKQFHESMSNILYNLLNEENIVVTTDDSIVCNEKCLEILSCEYTVYLKVSTTVQLDRISHNSPLLPTADYADFLNQLRTERDDLYERAASYSLSSDDGEIEDDMKSVDNAFDDKI